MFMGHSIGLDDHYFKPGENYVLREYLMLLVIWISHQKKSLQNNCLIGERIKKIQVLRRLYCHQYLEMHASITLTT
jgi:hypothetical protein